MAAKAIDIHRQRKLERAAETAVATLDPMVLLAGSGSLLSDAGQRQTAVVKVDFEIVAGESRQLGGDHIAVGRFVHVDGRWLDPGTDIHLRVSTKRSDGRWAGADRTFTSGKNRSDQTYYQLRGVGGGLRLTDVHVKHFAEPGQTSFFPPSTAKATYGRWNGPEASPRK